MQSTSKPKLRQGTPTSAQKKSVFSYVTPDDAEMAREYKTVRSSGVRYLMQSPQHPVTIKDENGNRVVRSIRYCPGESSIFVEDQHKDAIKKSVVFESGRLFVPANKPNLMEYLDTHPDNKANGGNKFYLVDKDKDSSEKVQTAFDEHDAVSLIKEKDFDELIEIATAYGIGVDRKANEIKHDLIIQAKANPKAFIASFDSPEMKIKAKVRLAHKQGIIKFDKRAIKWSDTGRVILTIPAGKKHIEMAVGFFMTDDGAEVLNEIGKQL